MDYSENFLTQDQIEKLIELPFITFHGMLDRYIYLKCLVLGLENEITYVDGYFVIGLTEHSYDEYSREQIDEEYLQAEPDMPEIVVNVIITEFSNNDDLLIGETVSLKSSQEVEEVLYSYKQLCELMKKFGCPEPKPLTELTKKEYAYDISLVNQKSNFTLEDAAKIAANIYSTSSDSPEVFMNTPLYKLYEHYKELLSDCIKGTNQHGFKLYTVELWCSYYDEVGESYSKSYDNGIYLKQKATLNSELTIISKREFVRWCEYENVDTGLFYYSKNVDESIEALKVKLDESEKEVVRLRDLIFTDTGNTVSNEESYPPELQLAIDAYIHLCLNKEKLPTNKNLEEWLEKESKERGITHKDGSKELKGLSNKKLETIPSIIKS